eukprot:3544429-Rhodomonas_salina.1
MKIMWCPVQAFCPGKCTLSPSSRALKSSSEPLSSTSASTSLITAVPPALVVAIRSFVLALITGVIARWVTRETAVSPRSVCLAAGLHRQDCTTLCHEFCRMSL